MQRPLLARRGIEVRPFGGVLADGRQADLYVLTAENGMSAQITNYGGIVTALRTPDRDGTLDDVVLGYDRLEDYVRDPVFLRRRDPGGMRTGSRMPASRSKGERSCSRAERTAAPLARRFGRVPQGAVGGANVRKTASGAFVWSSVTEAPTATRAIREDLDVRVVYALTDDGELVIECAPRPPVTATRLRT